jgi:hypothetical protein
MRFVMFKGEKSVTDLANRLFRIQGRGSQAAIKQAADALLKANPQLKDPSKVPAGSLLAVPDTAPSIAPHEEAISVGLVRSATAQNIQAAFDSLHQRLGDIETTAVNQVNAVTAQLQTSEFKAALKSVVGLNPAFAQQAANLDSLAKDSKDTLKNIQAVQDSRAETMTRLRTAVSSFTKG